jgi:DNA-binding NtrC family response regulator
MNTILLIDDDAPFREALKDILEEAGNRVIEACDGTQGLSIYQSHSHDVDLVISDMLMPNCDGVELLSKIRSVNPNVKVIIISGGGKLNTDIYLSLANKLGADDILKKPVSSEDICSAINRVLLCDV